jgi:hypothetical protein
MGSFQQGKCYHCAARAAHTRRTRTLGALAAAVRGVVAQPPCLAGLGGPRLKVEKIPEEACLRRRRGAAAARLALALARAASLLRQPTGPGARRQAGRCPVHGAAPCLLGAPGAWGGGLKNAGTCLCDSHGSKGPE